MKNQIQLLRIAMFMAVLTIFLSSCGPSAAELEQAPTSSIIIEKVGQNWLALKPSGSSLSQAVRHDQKLIYLDTKYNPEGKEDYFWFRNNQSGKINLTISTNNPRHLPSHSAYLITDTLKKVDEIAYLSYPLGPDLQPFTFTESTADVAYLNPGTTYKIRQEIAYKFNAKKWFVKINYRLLVNTVTYNPKTKELLAPTKIIDNGPRTNIVLIIILFFTLLFPIAVIIYDYQSFYGISKKKASYLSFWLPFILWVSIFWISGLSFGYVTQTTGIRIVEFIIAIIIGFTALFANFLTKNLYLRNLIYEPYLSLIISFTVASILGSIIVSWNLHFLYLSIIFATIGIFLPWLWITIIKPFWDRFRDVLV